MAYSNDFGSWRRCMITHDLVGLASMSPKPVNVFSVHARCISSDLLSSPGSPKPAAVPIGQRSGFEIDYVQILISANRPLGIRFTIDASMIDMPFAAGEDTVLATR